MPKVKLNPHAYDIMPQTIRVYMAMRGIKTVTALADKLGESRARVSYWLKHPTAIKPDVQERIARVLKVEPYKLWQPVEAVSENCKPLEVRA